MPARPLAFVHIPKTAGTTMHTVLKQQYARDRILITNNPRNPIYGTPDTSDPEDCSKKFDLILGHCPVGIHEIFKEFNYISCVRDPTKRLISHYHYARQLPSHYLYEKLNQKGFSFQDYVGADFSSEISNGMIRMLSGRPDYRTCEVNDDLYEATISLIEKHFKFIGSTERFDESLLILQKEIGLEAPYYARKKVGSYKREEIELTPEILVTIRERNKYDQMIYEYVNKSIDDFSHKNNISKSSVDEFKARNKKIGKWVYLGRELKTRLSGRKVVNGSSPIPATRSSKC